MLENDIVELTDFYKEKKKKTSKIIPNEQNNVSIVSTRKSLRKSSKHIFRGTIRVIYHIKDYLYTFLLLVMPCPNFSFLHIPYYIFGIISLFFLLHSSIQSRNKKFIIEIFTLIYSLISASFKGFLLLTNIFQEDRMIQIGLAMKRNKDDIFFIFTTFIPDGTILLISILSMIITQISKKYNVVINKKIYRKTYYYMIRIFLWFDFFFVSAFSSYNISYFSLLYTIIINIPLLLWCLRIDKVKITKLFNFISIALLFLMVLINLITFYLNIYNFYPKENQVEQYFGIQNMNGDFSLNNIHLWTGYILSNICIILFKTTDLLINNNVENDKLKGVIVDEKISMINSSEEKTIKKIILYIKQYLTSPNFVLHFLRIGIIIWIYFYRNYASFFLLIWLCLTFIFYHTSKNLIFTKYIAFPSLYYTIIMFHYSNIPFNYDNPNDEILKIKKEHFCLYKFVYEQRIEYSSLYLLLLFMYLFFYSLIRHIEEKKNQNNKNDENYSINNKDLNMSLINKNNNKEKDKNKNSFSIVNFFLKIILTNIDKLTLVSMYFVANQSVNFSHLLLVIFFVIQLLSPKKFEKLCIYILILVELIFVIEYILDLSKVFSLSFNFEKIELFVLYSKNLNETSIEILLFLAIYCLYIQYEFLNSSIYQTILNKKEEDDELENNNNKNNSESKINCHNIVKKIFKIIKKIFLEIYVWIIVILCFFLLCAFEINILFLGKFIIYLFILYDFLISIQEKKNLNKFAGFIFLIYCSINTLLIYFYQFSQNKVCKNFFNNMYMTILPNFIYNNLAPIGFIPYSKNLPYKFIPHFGLNFLSILFVRETNRIIKHNEKKKNKAKNNLKMIEENDDNNNNSIDNNIEFENKKNKNENKKERVLDKINNEILEYKIKYYFFQFIILITQFYLLLLFLSICFILVNYDISLATTLYISIFGILFIFLFRKRIKSLRKFISNESFFLSKLIRYSQIELPIYFETNKYYRSLILKILLIFSEIYILLVYIYANFYMIQHKCDCDTHNCISDHYEIISKEIEDYVSPICYLINIYINIEKNTILDTIKFYLILSGLIAFDVYVQKIEYSSIDKLMEIKDIIKKLEKEKKDINHNLKMKNKNIYGNIGNEIQFIKDNIEDDNDEENDIFISKQKIRTSSIYLRDELNKNKKDRGFEILKEQFRKIFTRAAQSKLKLKSENHFYTIIKVIKNILEELIILILLCASLTKANLFSYIYIIISIIFIFKKKTMYQYYILLVILVCSIIIQSIFFVTNLTIDTDPEGNKEMLELINKKLNFPWFEYLYHKLIKENSINWECWAFTFGIGIDKTQINSIWFEFVLICFIFIYLDLFSFSIYQEVLNTGQKIRNSIDKINYYNLSQKKKIIDSIKNMHDNDFEDYKNCMMSSFNINIGKDFNDFKKKFFLDEKNENLLNSFEILEKNEEEKKEEDKKEEEKIEEDKKEVFNEMPEKDIDEINTNIKIDNDLENISPLKSILLKNKQKIKENEKEKNNECFKKAKTIIYLSFHNFIIVIIILISMMISGLISITYFIFSLIFLIESPNLILGTYFSYPKRIKVIIRTLILLDILLQLIIQIPINSKLCEKYKTIESIEKILGLSQIINYNNYNNKVNITVNEEGLRLIFGKIITLFLINLQVLMFSSQDFQEFYLSYLITKKDRIKRTQMMNVFIFNNKRIEKMNENISRRITMEKSMDLLEKTLEEWNQKLTHINEEKPINLLDSKKIDQSDNISVMTGGSTILDEEYVREKIKKFILNGFLVKILLFLHKSSSSYSSIEKDRKIHYERDMIQGKTYTKLYLEELIDNELSSLDMSCYKKKDIKIIQQILSGKLKRKDFIDENENIEEEKEINLANIMNKFDEDYDIDNKKSKKKKKNKKNKIEDDLNKEKDKDDKNSKRKKKEKEIKVDFKLEKFKRIDDLREGEIYKKYLKKSTLLLQILLNLLHYFSIHFHYLCYLIMIINHMISSSFISLVYPISIFCYAFPQYPRPSKKYWNFILYISVFILVIKFVIQFDFLYNLFLKYILTTLEFYRVGLKKFDSTFSKNFFKYIIGDALVLIFNSIEIYILINEGLWKDREQDIENIYEANERVLKTKDLILKNEEEIMELNKKYIYKKDYLCNLNSSDGLFKDEENKKNEKLIEDVNEESEENEEEEEKEKIMDVSKIKELYENHLLNEEEENEESDDENIYEEEDKKESFFNNLFPKIRNEKPGRDYYVFYTSTYILILLYIIIFYTNMEQDKTFGAVIEQQKQVSGNMVVILILHVLFFVCDRIIYIRQNRNNLKYKYAIYNKETNNPISQKEYDEIKSIIIDKYENMNLENNFKIPLNYIDKLNEKYKIVIIQHEEFNYPLFLKYIHQIIITLFSHIIIFFFLPFKGTYNILGTPFCEIKKNEDNKTNECNNFQDNKYMIVFYILYLIYLLFSSLQIQKGLLDMKKKSILKEGVSSINSGIYNGYKNTPFLYEIKLAIDWTFTKTSLDFFRWAKFESVYDTIYLTMCSMKIYKTKPVGLEISIIKKITMGGIIWVSLISLLILPLIIFSNLNPINESNNVTGAKSSLKISFVKNNIYSNYTLYENSHIEGIENMFNEDDSPKIQWQLFKYNNSYMRNFPHDQIQIIYMSNTSDHVWDIAIPHIEMIKEKLKKYNESDIIELYYEFNFQRPKPAENKDSIKHIEYKLLDKEKDIFKNETIQNLYNSINNCNSKDILLDYFYKAPMRLSSTAHPKLIDLEKDTTNINTILSFHNCKNITDDNSTKVSYTESYFQLKKNESYDKEYNGIEFHTFSDKVSSVSSSYSVLTFYVSFVLIAGSYVRGFLQGHPEKIILTEMPETEQLANLCEGIKTARFSFDLEKEEHLYYVLIELMRSPDYLKLLTKSSLQQFKDRRDNLKLRKYDDE